MEGTAWDTRRVPPARVAARTAQQPGLILAAAWAGAGGWYRLSHGGEGTGRGYNAPGHELGPEEWRTCALEALGVPGVMGGIELLSNTTDSPSSAIIKRNYYEMLCLIAMSSSD
jgi:hypothetical protein